MPSTSLRRVKQSLDDGGYQRDRGIHDARRARVVGQLRRVGDIAIASVLLTITGPLIAFAAVAVRCETRGPAFERSEHGVAEDRGSTSLKLRTRVRDPGTPGAGELTSVGRFLEYTRIDALPRLINVVRGEMSLVDPDRRSHAFLD